MEEKEAVELLEKCDADYVYAKAIKTILNLLEKKDKIIDEMTGYIFSSDFKRECGHNNEQVKQYFEKKSKYIRKR